MDISVDGSRSKRMLIDLQLIHFHPTQCKRFAVLSIRDGRGSIIPQGGPPMGLSVAVIQTLSAFIIFVAGYLVLLIMIICLLVLASCIYKDGRLLRAYTVRPACRDRNWPAAENGLHQGAVVQR